MNDFIKQYKKFLEKNGNPQKARKEKAYLYSELKHYGLDRKIHGTFYKKHKDVLPKKPEASMSSMDRLGREITIRMLFPEGRINEFYDLQPELMQDIVTCWDCFKAKKSC